jgi:hypothetical protein
MTQREVEEYRALRATIRERGTARVWIGWTGLAAWAALTIATAGLVAIPAIALVPLLVLAATFEIVFSLHTGVERIGRYLQVFYEDEDDAPRRWETTIMSFAGRQTTIGADPLFAAFFESAVALNLTLVLLAEPRAVEWVVLGTVHVLVAARIVIARRETSRQRALDLEDFRRLRQLPAQRSGSTSVLR